MALPVISGYLKGYLHTHIYVCIKAIRRYNDVHYTFPNVARWPQDVSSFERLDFLFPSSQANFGLCLLAFDEASYLYEIAKSVGPGRLAEIGRFKGGGTFLIAAAMDPQATLDSFDIHLITSLYNGTEPVEIKGHEMDSELGDALERYGLAERVQLLVQDSATVKLEPESYNLVFVDGDHSYDGAKRDFLHWKDALKPGGHMLFHDAANTRPFSSFSPDLLRLMGEIEQTYPEFAKIAAVGTLVHFRKR